MKLTLNAAEAAPFVRKFLFLPEGTTVEIIGDNVPSGKPVDVREQLRILANRAVREVERFGYSPINKIPAIKLLRELTPYGLAQSKWAIENFETVREFVENNGRFPDLECDIIGRYRMV